MARGLGVDDQVTSPTYTLVNEYEGTIPFYHFDAYRLASAEEFDRLGVDEYLFGDGVCAIEWSERVEAALPGDSVVVEIAPLDSGERLIRVTGKGIEEAIA